MYLNKIPNQIHCREFHLKNTSSFLKAIRNYIYIYLVIIRPRLCSLSYLKLHHLYLPVIFVLGVFFRSLKNKYKKKTDIFISIIPSDIFIEHFWKIFHTDLFISFINIVVNVLCAQETRNTQSKQIELN